MSKSKILFQLSGSIAAYKACGVISQLVQKGCEVQVVASSAALQFVGVATLEGLTGRSVFSETFTAGKMMDHIHLAKWADLAVLCPASADAINRLAAGLAGDVIGQLHLAWDRKKPYLLVPAMNQEMFGHPATQSGIEKLSSWGVKVMPTSHGHQACGDVGPGRMPEPLDILNYMERFLI